MTEEQDALDLRRVFVAALAAFLAIGVLRGSVQLFMGPKEPLRAWYLYRVTVPVSLFWVPVALAIAGMWRSRRRRWRFVLAHAVLLAAVLFLEVLWVGTIIRRFSPTMEVVPFAVRLVGRFDTNLLMYAAIVGAVWAAESVRRETTTRLAATRLDALLADTRLHVLTLQLHPHFLFNTLNLISQLAYRDGAVARRTLGNLRGLLVQSLNHAGSRAVPLRDELEFLGAYLEIQQRRFGERLRVRTEIAPETLDAEVPHLLLQPLVENAILHGLANKPDGGELRITARVSGDRLMIGVEDDGVGVGERPAKERVGLTNTRLRLHQFSDGDYRFTMARRSIGGTEVSIVVPLRTGASTVASRQNVGTLSHADDDRAALPEIPKRSSRLMVGVQTVAGWTAVAVLWTELSAAQRVVRNAPIEWGPSIINSVVNALILALLTPGVLYVARRLDLVRSRSWRNIGGHAAAAIAMAALHLLLLLAFLRRFVPSEYAIELRNLFAWSVWDLVAYATIVAFGTVATMAGRYRDALVAMTATRARIANARLASLRLRLQPVVLLRGLDAIDVAMSADPERAEHAITRMGDLLRSLLTRVDRDSVTLDAELAMLGSFVDVVHPGAVVSATRLDPDATMPAVLLTALAAALARVTSVVVRPSGDALDVRFHAQSSAVDDAQLAQIRDRLKRRYGAAASLVIEPSRGDGIDVLLRVPLERAAESDGEESMFEPTLVVA